MEKILIIPEDICADRMLVAVEGGVIDSLEIEGGCDGNSKAVARLLKDMPVEKAAALLAGVECGDKGTSCADQLARGLKDWASEREGKSGPESER